MSSGSDQDCNTQQGLACGEGLLGVFADLHSMRTECARIASRIVDRFHLVTLVKKRAKKHHVQQ